MAFTIHMWEAIAAVLLHWASPSSQQSLQTAESGMRRVHRNEEKLYSYESSCPSAE